MSILQRTVVLIGILVVMAAGVVVFLVVQGGAGGIRAGFDSEFLERPDGYPGLSEAYDLRFSSQPMHLDPGLMYRAAADGQVDVICAFATDGRIAAYDLLVLEDDKKFFPPYYAAPLVRGETLQEHPALKGTLAALAGKLPDGVMQELNYEVDEKGRRASAVAREFLIKEGMIAEDAEAGTGQAGTVSIGGKEFTEQEILGELMAILVETRTDIAVDRKLNLGGTMICFNALKTGDLDLYAEYTGTGLVNILGRQVVQDPDEAYAQVKEAFEEEWDMVWLQPFGFNNTYTLTMRRDHAADLGIETISDLARAVREEQESE